MCIYLKVNFSSFLRSLYDKYQPLSTLFGAKPLLINYYSQKIKYVKRTTVDVFGKSGKKSVSYRATAGQSEHLVMMQRDIGVNNNDLAGLSDTINTLRSEVREVRQRLDKQDENVNLRSSVFTQTECLQVPPQLFSNYSQAICIDNSTQTTEIKPAKQQLCSSYIQTNCLTQTIDTDPIKLQHCLNQAQVNDNDNSTQTIDTETIDTQSNNRVIITRNIIPLVSETKDESIVEINGSNIKVVHNPCKDLNAVALSTDSRS